MTPRQAIALALRYHEAAYGWLADEFYWEGTLSDGTEGNARFAQSAHPGPFASHEWSETIFWEAYQIWAAWFTNYASAGATGWPVVASANNLAEIARSVVWFNQWALGWRTTNFSRLRGEPHAWPYYAASDESDQATIDRVTEGVFADLNVAPGDWSTLEETAHAVMLTDLENTEFGPVAYHPDPALFFPHANRLWSTWDVSWGARKASFVVHNAACKAWLLLMDHKASTNPIAAGDWAIAIKRTTETTKPAATATRTRTIVAVTLGTGAALALVWWALA